MRPEHGADDIGEADPGLGHLDRLLPHLDLLLGAAWFHLCHCQPCKVLTRVQVQVFTDQDSCGSGAVVISGKVVFCHVTACAGG